VALTQIIVSALVAGIVSVIVSVATLRMRRTNDLRTALSAMAREFEHARELIITWRTRTGGRLDWGSDDYKQLRLDETDKHTTIVAECSDEFHAAVRRARESVGRYNDRVEQLRRVPDSVSLLPKVNPRESASRDVRDCGEYAVNDLRNAIYAARAEIPPTLPQRVRFRVRQRLGR
jgi:hypothetical protein